jgi:hypothetical protein
VDSLVLVVVLVVALAVALAVVEDRSKVEEARDGIKDVLELSKEPSGNNKRTGGNETQ